MSTLHVYRNLVIDWVIALSPDDADAVCREHTGAAADDEDAHEWIQLPDDNVLWIRDDDGGRQEKTCAAWVAEKGRCFLASTEY